MPSKTMKVEILGDAKDYLRSLDKAEGRSETFGRSVRSKVGGAAKVAGKAALGLGAAAGTAGAAMLAAAKKAADHGDRVAKAGRMAGVSAESYQELEYAMGQAGLSAENGAKVLRRLNERVGAAADGNAKYQAAFEKLGVSIKDGNGNLRENDDIMSDVLGSLSSIEDEQLRATRTAEIFGKKVGPEMASLVAAGSEGLEEARQRARDLGIVMDEDAAGASERFTDALDNVTQQAGALARQAGTALLPILADKILPFISEKLVPALKSFAAWLGPKIEASVAIIQEWWPRVQAVFQGVADVIQTVVGWFQKAFGGDGEVAGSMEGARSKIQEVWDRISAIFQSAWDAIGAIVSTLVEVVTKLWRAFGDDLLKWAKRTWTNIQKMIGAVLDVIHGIFETFAGVFTGDWDRAWDGIKKIASGIWDAIKAIFDQFLNNVTTIFVAFRDELKRLWDRAWQWIKDKAVEWWDKTYGALIAWVADMWDKFTGWIADVKDAWVAALTNLRDKMAEWGGKILDKAKAWLSDTWDSLTGWIADVKDEWVAFWTNIRDKAGEWMTKTKDRIVERWAAIKDWFAGLGGKVRKAVGDVGTALKRKGADIIQGLWDGMKDVWDRAWGWLRDIPSKISDKLSWVPGVGAGYGFGGGPPSEDTPGAGLTYGSWVRGKNTASRLAETLRLPGVVTSTYRPGARTSTGNQSYHARNRAVDIGGTMSQLWAIFRALKARFKPIIKELIFSPAGAGQVWNGQDYFYRSGTVRRDHWDHVHLALARGGLFKKPFAGQVVMAERHPEIVSPVPELRRIFREELRAARAPIVNVLVYLGDEQLEPHTVRVVEDRLDARDRDLVVAARQGGF